MVLAHLISKIYDQYSNFVSLEDQLFILRHQNRDQICYYNLNRNNITEEEMNSAVDHIVDGWVILWPNDFFGLSDRFSFE